MAESGTDTGTDPRIGRPAAPGAAGWPAGPGDGRDARSRRRTAGRVGGAIVLVVLLVVLAGTVVRLPYVIISPGDATPVGGVVEVAGAPTFPAEGELLFLTVSVSTRDPNVWRTLRAWLDDDRELRRKEDYLGTNTREEERQLNVALMEQSQLEATRVALEYLGYTVAVSGRGALVVAVLDDGPASGVLRAGDVVVAVDGRPITLGEELGAAVRRVPPGSTVVLTVARDGQRTDVAVETGTAPEGPYAGQAFLGVSVATDDLTYDFPVDVRIDTGRVGGPSAGLAFSLAIIDEMTPGDLTGGAEVAVTGTIAGDGQVGPVGGVPQKAVTARQAGADLMLVPASEVEQARDRAGRMAVVGVSTLEEALAALEAAGGDPVVLDEVRPAA